MTQVKQGNLWIYFEGNSTNFMNRNTDRVPTGFIITGPNIASQSLLFKQLSSRLKTEINGPVVVLRSGDATNLKAVLKQLIRDATNQRHGDDDEDGLAFVQDVRNYTNHEIPS